MVRPVGVFLLLFAVLSLIVHQIGMFELLVAVATTLLGADIMISRFSKTPRTPTELRQPFV